jgi:hypothetical protein
MQQFDRLEHGGCAAIITSSKPHRSEQRALVSVYVPRERLSLIIPPQRKQFLLKSMCVAATSTTRQTVLFTVPIWEG